MKRGSEDLFFREFVPRQRNSRREVDDPRGEKCKDFVFGRCIGLWSLATPGRSVESWGSRGRCSTDGRRGSINTVRRGCTRAGGGAGAGGRRRWRPTRNEPFWAWLCPGRHGVLDGSRRSFCEVRYGWHRARSIDSFDAPGWEVGMNGWPFSSTTAHGRPAFSPTALAAVSGMLATAVPATSRPRPRASWSAWI